jgi:hypothetical protein
MNEKRKEERKGKDELRKREKEKSVHERIREKDTNEK